MVWSQKVVLINELMKQQTCFPLYEENMKKRNYLKNNNEKNLLTKKKCFMKIYLYVRKNVQYGLENMK